MLRFKLDADNSTCDQRVNLSSAASRLTTASSLYGVYCICEGTGWYEFIPAEAGGGTQEEQTTKSSSSQRPPPGSDEEPMEEDSDMSEQAMECLEMVEADMRPVEIKSKDILRIGKAHPKADELVMRYASIDDRKQKGAYKHSQYYLKYGNPNFGGYKGLVSLSKRQQYRDGKYQPATSDRRKRRHGHQEDWEAEEEESLHPRKRKPDEAESKGHTTDLRERLKKGTAKRHSSGSEGEEEEDGEKRGKEDAVDEEAENLDAELKHAMGNVSPKRKMQMYADEVEAELKKFREEVGHQEPLYKVRDAREGLKNRLSVRDRLGHIRGAPTPASSLENLKIIVDTQDDISEKSSSEEEEEEEEEEEGEKSSKVKGALHQDDDLRAWLHNRETSRKLLENLPSLKIEVQDDT
ncbi:hypothetical protein BSL78_05729 [Apostichopus japonicus]|uniref:Nuclear cap-binding protein subunit 3 n=1 Tax=Stichopus japonicus TaxID=307972 RepID=A0A2G8LB00_STIJA|nr:hypothetical protein BSL78_05729 [Apostichopus japonicus]